MEIREATASDAISLSNFMNEISNEQLPYLVPFDFMFTPEVQLKHIINFSSTKNAFLLLCLKDDEIIGALDLMPHSSAEKNHAARIGILVKKENRGTGIGSLLMKHLFELLPQTDLKKIEAEIFTNNPASLALHLKWGFKVEGNKINAYRVNGVMSDVINLHHI